MDKKISPASPEVGSRLKMGPNGMLVFPSTGRVITSEMVKKAEEEMADEEMERVLELGGYLKKASPAEGSS